MDRKDIAGGFAAGMLPMRDGGLTIHTCRFPLNDDMKAPEWCGGPVKKGSSYCPEHHSRCWYVLDKNRKRKRGNFTMKPLNSPLRCPAPSDE